MICPDCRNQYDTCSFCRGTGHVTAEKAASYVEPPPTPAEQLTNLDMALIAFVMLMPMFVVLATNWKPLP